MIKLLNKLKDVLAKMFKMQRKLEETLHVKPTISNEMLNSIELWSKMYVNKAHWLHEPNQSHAERVVSLGLPSFIASEKARMATLEMQSDISGSQRADYLNEIYQNTIMQDIRNQLEYGIAKGGLVIKPYIANNQINFEYVQAENFYPITFDACGHVTEACFVQRINFNGYLYSRVEHHRLINNNAVTVINKAFRQDNKNSNASYDDLGVECSLTEVPEWESIEHIVTINNVDRLLFAYFKMPIANNVDCYSPLGVSGYSRAVELIRDADEQYSRFLWEFEGSELAIECDRDLFNSDGTLSKKQNRLYQRHQFEDPDTWNVFNPTIRDASIKNGLNTILIRIEDACELSRGTLSDVNNEARTATEIAALKQRSYAANCQIQKSLEDTLNDVVYIMNVYATLYELAPEGEIEVSFEWDDSLITDRESELTKRTILLQNGIISKLEYRMWYFGETEEQAREALAKVEGMMVE